MIVTALYAALLTFWIVYLAREIGQERMAHKVSLGTGGVPSLERAVRAHGNAVETIPLALVLMALAESLGTPAWVLHGLGVMLVIGRVLHGLHLLQNRDGLAWRFWGMMLTVGMMALTALGLLGHGLARML